MRPTRSILRRITGAVPFQLRSPSILLTLTLQIAGIVTLGLIVVSLCTIAQMDRKMADAKYPEKSGIWNLGMHSSMIAIAVIVPVMIGAIAFTVWRSLRPLKQLSHYVTTNPIETGNLTNHALADMPAEVRALFQTYDTLLSTLNEAGAQQQQFMGSLSHELRTSLSLISGYLQHLQRCSANLTSPQQEALEIATAEAERMAQILQDSLELARAESHSLPFHLEVLTLNEVVENAVQITEKFRHQIIQVEAASPNIPVKADRERLLQVIVHLIDNALKRCETPQPVSLTLEQVDNSAVIHIRDRGNGIAISQAFHQPMDLSEIRTKESVDLGLAIVDTLVRRMGGKVSVQSLPRQGSNLWVTLPIR